MNVLTCRCLIASPIEVMGRCHICRLPLKMKTIEPEVEVEGDSETEVPAHRN